MDSDVPWLDHTGTTTETTTPSELIGTRLIEAQIEKYPFLKNYYGVKDDLRSQRRY